jgi:hypothetical protein
MRCSASAPARFSTDQGGGKPGPYPATERQAKPDRVGAGLALALAYDGWYRLCHIHDIIEKSTINIKGHKTCFILLYSLRPFNLLSMTAC